MGCPNTSSPFTELQWIWKVKLVYAFNQVAHRHLFSLLLQLCQAISLHTYAGLRKRIELEKTGTLPPAGNLKLDLQAIGQSVHSKGKRDLLKLLINMQALNALMLKLSFNCWEFALQSSILYAK